MSKHLPAPDLANWNSSRTPLLFEIGFAHTQPSRCLFRLEQAVERIQCRDDIGCTGRFTGGWCGHFLNEVGSKRDGCRSFLPANGARPARIHSATQNALLRPSSRMARATMRRTSSGGWSVQCSYSADRAARFCGSVSEAETPVFSATGADGSATVVVGLDPIAACIVLELTVMSVKMQQKSYFDLTSCVTSRNNSPESAAQNDET